MAADAAAADPPWFSAAPYAAPSDDPEAPGDALRDLEPIGVGTPEVESLTGYIARLAEAHGGLTGPLISTTIAPLLGGAYQRSGVPLHQCFYDRAARMVNGVGETAASLVRALELLTGRTDLRFLTMLTWRDVLSSRELTRGARAWCPACLHDDAAAGAPVYERLAWALRAVAVCSRHGGRLRDRCPHAGCGAAQTPLAHRIRPGRCAACGGWLGAPSMGQARSPAWERWAAEQTGTLLARAPGLGAGPAPGAFGPGLDAALGDAAGAAAARAAGLGKTTVWRWRRGGGTVVLGGLLRVCAVAAVSPADVLAGVTPAASVLPARPTPRPRRAPPLGQERWEEVEQALEAALSLPDPPGVQGTARRLGVPRTSLHNRFPDLSRQLAERHRAHRAAATARRFRDDAERVRRAVAEMARDSAQVPTLYAVGKNLGRRIWNTEVALKAVFQETLRELGLPHPDEHTAPGRTRGDRDAPGRGASARGGGDRDRVGAAATGQQRFSAGAGASSRIGG